MTTEDQSAASDVSEQTEPQGEVKEQTQSQAGTTSLAEALKAAAIADGIPYGDGTETAQEPPKVVAEEEAPEPEAEPEAQSDEPEQPTAVERKSIDEQIAEAKRKGEKPAWYLTRIAEESEKRRRALEDAGTVRLDLQKAIEEKQSLEQRLSQASMPQPTPQQPLIDVFDEPKMQKLEQSYETILETMEKHRDGPFEAIGYDANGDPIEGTTLIVGKNDKGEPIEQKFSKAQMAELRYKADRALRKDIPQRRAFLAQRAQAFAAAEGVYPELKDGNSQLTQEVISVLKANPMIETIIGPEAPIWVSMALKERARVLAQYGSNGNGQAPTNATQKIVKAAATRIAPTPPKTRSTFERKSGPDLAQAKKKLEESGDEEAGMAYLEAARARRQGSAKMVT